MKKKPGRPPIENPKVQAGVRLDYRVMACIKAQDNQTEYLEGLVMSSKQYREMWGKR